jgi:hypothetical protein
MVHRIPQVRGGGGGRGGGEEEPGAPHHPRTGPHTYVPHALSHSHRTAHPCHACFVTTLAL